MVVHVAERLWFIGQRNPGSQTVERERLLPRMGKVEGVAHFMAGGPEDRPPNPSVRVRVARRCLSDERVVEYSSSLPMVRADVIEHDATETCAPFMQGSKEHPHGPLRLSDEARPVGLHSIVHLGVAPHCVRT